MPFFEDERMTKIPQFQQLKRLRQTFVVEFACFLIFHNNTKGLYRVIMHM